MPLSDFFGIKYKFVTSENYGELMKALDVSVMERKIENAAMQVLKMTEKNGEYTLSTTSTFENYVIKFKLGEEFEERTPDGRNVRTTITQEGGNKLVQLQKGEKRNCKIVHEFTKHQVVMTLTVGDIKCTRIYKALL